MRFVIARPYRNICPSGSPFFLSRSGFGQCIDSTTNSLEPMHATTTITNSSREVYLVCSEAFFLAMLEELCTPARTLTQRKLKIATRHQSMPWILKGIYGRIGKTPLRYWSQAGVFWQKTLPPMEKSGAIIPRSMHRR